jgi:hypothetical protein
MKFLVDVQDMSLCIMLLNPLLRQSEQKTFAYTPLPY